MSIFNQTKRHNEQSCAKVARKVLLVFLSLLLSVAQATPANCQTSTTQPGDAKTVKLKNGLRVLLIEEPAFPILSCQLWLRTGSLNDPSGGSGTCHVIEHLLAETMKANGGSLARQLVGSGGRFDAFTSDDFTVFLENLPVSQLELALNLQAERLKEKSFSQPQLTEAVRQVTQELEGANRNPDRTLMREVRSLVYTRHPYKNLPAGIEEEIKALTPQTVTNYFNNYFVPSNAILVIAGDIKQSQVMSLVEKQLGSLREKSASAPLAVPSEPVQPGERRVYLKYGGKKNKVLVAFHAPAATEANAASAAVAECLLGNSASGLLTDNLIANKICDSCSTAFELRKQPGMFAITLEGSGTSNPSKMLSTVEEICDKIKDGGFDEASLAEAKKHALFSWQKNKMGPYRRAFQLGLFDAINKLDQADLWQKQIEAVTKQDVMRLAATYLVPAKRCVGFMLAQATPSPQKTAFVDSQDDSAVAAERSFVNKQIGISKFATKLDKAIAESSLRHYRALTDLARLQAAAYDPYLQGSRTDGTDEPSDEAPDSIEESGDLKPSGSKPGDTSSTASPTNEKKTNSDTSSPASTSKDDSKPTSTTDKKDTSSKQDTPSKTDASSKRDNSSKSDSSKQDSSSKTDATSKQNTSSKTDSSPKPDASTKQDASSQTDASAKQDTSSQHNTSQSSSTNTSTQTAPPPTSGGSSSTTKTTAPSQATTSPFTTPAATTQSSPPSPAQAAGSSPPAVGLRNNMTQHVLGNGIRLLIFRVASSPVIRIAGAVRAGHVYDPVAKPGISDVTVALMNAGSAKISKENSTNMQTQIGLDRGDQIRFSEGREYISFTTNCLVQDLPVQLKLISHHLTDPLMDDTSLSAARNSVAGAIKRRQNTTQDRANRLLLQNLLSDKSQFNPPGPHELLASVLKITADDVNQFRTNYVGPATTTIVMAGNIDAQNAQRLVSTAFKDWQSKARTQTLSAAANKRQVTKVNLPTDDAVKVELAIGRLLSTPASKPEYTRLLLSDCALLKHPLYARLTNQNKLKDVLDDSISMHSTIMPLSSQCAWILNVRSSEQKLRGITGAIKQQFKELGTTGLSNQELNEMKRFIGGQVSVNRLADVVTSADSIIDAVATEREPDYWFSLPSNIDKTNLNDVNAFIKDEFQPDKSCVVIAGSKEAIKQLPSLRRNKD